MKKLLIFFLLLNNYSFSQTYTWASTDTSYQSYNGALAAMAKDSFGNLFVAYAPKINSAMADFIAIVKYDTGHNIVWSQKIAANNIGFLGIGLCSDASGNIYVTSYFYGDLFFNSTVCASISGGNMFLIKMNTSGAFQWVKHTTGGQVWGSVLSSDAQNNIYVAGNINGDAYFDSVFVSSPSLVHNYIAKYNSSGQFQWVKQPSGSSFGGFANIGMATDHFGNSYLTGTFYTWADFDGIPLTAMGGYLDEDVYISKIDANGNWVWAVNAGGIEQDAIYGRGLAIDNNGGLYITGFIGSATATFGSITLTNTGEDDYFLAKYDTAGTALWAINGGGAGSQFGINVCADSYGNSYINTSGKFLSKYDSNGNFIWSQLKPAANVAMLSDNAGKIYITGYFNNTVSFDSYTFSPNSPYVKQMFVAELHCTQEITTAVNEPKHYTSDFSVFPNPTSRIITIGITTTKPTEAFTLKVTNSLGKNVYFETIKEISGSFTKQIDLSSLPKGIYFLELKSNSTDSQQKKAEVKKIVLQ